MTGLKNVLIGLVIGLLVGGSVVGFWSRYQAGQLQKQLRAQEERAAEAKSKLAGVEAKLDQLGKDLETEQSLRRNLEKVAEKKRR